MLYGRYGGGEVGGEGVGGGAAADLMGHGRE